LTQLALDEKLDTTGPISFKAISTIQNGALYLDFNNLNGPNDYDNRIMSSGGSSSQSGQGILTFTNLRTIFNEIQSPTISTKDTTLTNL
jgi:hypothetical protein